MKHQYKPLLLLYLMNLTVGAMFTMNDIPGRNYRFTRGEIYAGTHRADRIIPDLNGIASAKKLFSDTKVTCLRNQKSEIVDSGAFTNNIELIT